MSFVLHEQMLSPSGYNEFQFHQVMFLLLSCGLWHHSCFLVKRSLDNWMLVTSAVQVLFAILLNSALRKLVTKNVVLCNLMLNYEVFILGRFSMNLDAVSQVFMGSSHQIPQKIWRIIKGDKNPAAPELTYLNLWCALILSFGAFSLAH